MRVLFRINESLNHGIKLCNLGEVSESMDLSRTNLHNGGFVRDSLQRSKLKLRYSASEQWEPGLHLVQIGGIYTARAIRAACLKNATRTTRASSSFLGFF
jgi:hypothetical protein